MEEAVKEEKNDERMERMFKVGAHFGYSKSRRHPSMKRYIFGVKNRVEIFDLEKTKNALQSAKEFVKSLGALGKQILFVGGKNEAKDILAQGALSLDMPYVATRWIGGTLTNFAVIRSRVERLLFLRAERDGGGLAKYTKKERLIIDREISHLEKYFSGLISLATLPAALFVIDPRFEHIAVTEAHKKNVPVIALMSSDCDLDVVDYPVVGNDSAIPSIRFFTEEIIESYKSGRGEALVAVPSPEAPKLNFSA